jgi:hypothetical protein
MYVNQQAQNFLDSHVFTTMNHPGSSIKKNKHTSSEQFGNTTLNMINLDNVTFKLFI